MTIAPLSILTIEQQHDLVAKYLNGQLTDNPIHILEAGCGREWYFELPRGRYKLSGIDADKAALSARQSRENDLDEAIVGDLRDVHLPEASYDVIYNAYVLEHIDGASHVLDRFRTWLKPGGIIILYIPDRQSVYGYLSMITPHWVHVWFYRYLLGRPNAGKPGFAPYQTYYDDVVSREGIRAYAQEHGLAMREECGYYRPQGAAGFLIRVLHALSFGRLASDHCDLLFILQKPVIASSSSGRRQQESYSTSFAANFERPNQSELPA